MKQVLLHAGTGQLDTVLILITRKFVQLRFCSLESHATQSNMSRCVFPPPTTPLCDSKFHHSLITKAESVLIPSFRLLFCLQVVFVLNLKFRWDSKYTFLW